MISNSNMTRIDYKQKAKEVATRTIYLILALCLVGLILGGITLENPQPTHASTNQNSEIFAASDWTDETLTHIYNRKNGQWELMTYGDVGPDTEFIIDNTLYATTEWGAPFLKPGIDIDLVADADRAFDPNNWRMPNPNDIVFLYQSSAGQQKGHWLLKNVQPDSEVVFQGKVWRWELDSENQRFVVSDTGNVFARVTDTHVNFHKDDVLALTVRFDSCGKTDIITGSEEHPFYVLDVENFVPMVDLQPDMRLKTDNGTSAVVVELNRLDESLELYNLTIEHVQNYYIYTSEDAPGVLVHNTGPCDVVSRAISAGLPNRNGVGKTTGYLFDGDGNLIGTIISGRNPYSFDNTLVRGANGALIIQDHVEAQAAGMMRDLNISEATLVVNNHPCSSGNYSCQNILPKMVPLDSVLQVIVPEGFDARGTYNQTFRGVP